MRDRDKLGFTLGPKGKHAKTCSENNFGVVDFSFDVYGWMGKSSIPEGF